MKSYREFPKSRPLGTKFGGDIEYKSYGKMEEDFADGNLHHADLKNSTAQNLNKIIAPVRDHFEKNAGARNLYNSLKKTEVTR